MKTVLIIAGIIVFLVYGFVLYCCIRVGKESDEQYNKLKEGKEQEDDRSRVCKATIYLWCVGEGHYFQIVRIANGVARDVIGKVVEELFAYSEELIAQGYDSYEKVLAFLRQQREKKGRGVIAG